MCFPAPALCHWGQYKGIAGSQAELWGFSLQENKEKKGNTNPN